MAFTIEEIQVPQRSTAPVLRPFKEYVTVRNAVEAHTLGTDLRPCVARGVVGVSRQPVPHPSALRGLAGRGDHRPRDRHDGAPPRRRRERT